MHFSESLHSLCLKMDAEMQFWAMKMFMLEIPIPTCKSCEFWEMLILNVYRQTKPPNGERYRGPTIDVQNIRMDSLPQAEMFLIIR